MMTLLFASFSLFAKASVQPDNDQRLWYDRPATVWLEALPLGNSRMGAMVYGGTETEEIQLNEETFWSGGPHNNNSTTSLQYLTEVRSLIFDGKERDAENLINKEFIKGPHGMRFLTVGSLNLEFGEVHPSCYRFIGRWCGGGECEGQQEGCAQFHCFAQMSVPLDGKG